MSLSIKVVAKIIELIYAACSAIHLLVMWQLFWLAMRWLNRTNFSVNSCQSLICLLQTMYVQYMLIQIKGAHVNIEKERKKQDGRRTCLLNITTYKVKINL